jgi:histidinol-phosphate aminotransferase
MNRRSFVQRIGAGAVGLAALESRVGAQAPAVAQGARPARGDMAGLVRIGSNENPYGPSPMAIQAVNSAAVGANRYPGPAVDKLVSTIAEKFGVSTDYVMLSGGSGDVLRAVATAFTGKTKPIVGGSPSYASPMRTTEALGNPVRAVPLTADLTLDLDRMVAVSTGAGVFYLCNPNNPTGTAVTAAAVESAIEKVLDKSPSTHILVDEAYFEYADLPGFGTAVPLTRKYPQVIIARTFSKIHGMAGMRVGYAIAQPETLDRLRKHHSSSGLSVMSLTAATASLLDKANQEKNIAMNREVRAMTVTAFEAAGYRVARSDSNFIFVDIKRDSVGFQDACRKMGVAVGRAFPPMLTHARISIGTRQEMETAIPVFMKVLAQPPQTASFIDYDALARLPTELT